MAPTVFREGAFRNAEQGIWLRLGDEQLFVRGSLCTVLVMADGTQRHMKTSTFDQDGAVTRKAKELIGSRVRTTCWDPIGSPGKYLQPGYFRNIYETK